LGVEQVLVAAVALPGEVGAEPALGHQPDLARPARHHRSHRGRLLLAELAREAEQNDVLKGHHGLRMCLIVRSPPARSVFGCALASGSLSVGCSLASGGLSRTRSTRASPSR